MGFRFRKSINLGGGLKVNLSKSGVGYSWGTKGVRFTKTAKGRKRTTLSIPGTGISYVTESGGNHKSPKKITKSETNKFSKPSYTLDNPNNERGNHMAWVKFAICFFLGTFGIHKFMEKKIGMGLLYLCTMGLFGFGWLYDCGKYLIAAIKSTNFNADKSNSPIEPAATVTVNINENHPVELPAVDFTQKIKKVLLWVVTVFFALAALAYLTSGGVITGFLAVAFVVLVIPVDRWQSTVKKFVKGKLKIIIAVVLAMLCFATVPDAEHTDAESTVPTTLVTEPTIEPTIGPTTEPTNEPTIEPTTEPTIEPTTEPATEPTTEPTTESTEDNGRDYVVNTSTGKFHYPSCSSADDIKASNRWDYHGTRDELINMGYKSCGRCHP